MKALFDQVSQAVSREFTQTYSTSFSSAVRMLAPSIRQDIYNIYGFVRLADEIVDSFHDYDKEGLFTRFEADWQHAYQEKISLNPVLNAFQQTIHQYHIPTTLVDAFLKSMKQDLYKQEYHSVQEYEDYIYGSADVVGLMCLKVFVQGDQALYDQLKQPAMRLGSAFQKVNFLRDLKADHEGLHRTYFPNTDLHQLDEQAKLAIIQDIEADFEAGFSGIAALPLVARFGVYTAYVYYKKLLSKLKKTPSSELKNTRIRVPDYQKVGLLAKCYFNFHVHGL
ncbi:MAG: phytoene synthase [Flavobacterium sp. BFFFF2]|nr:MAG: phytoene synthase [Flavobacterium sp. BFFFF2]